MARLRSSPLLALLIAATLVGAASGCNRYSRIRTHSGEPVRVLITGSNATEVQGLAPSGEVVTVPRADIAEVTYPGNVATKIFGAMFGVGLGLGALGGLFRVVPEGDTPGVHLAGAMLLITGGAIALAGSGPLVWYLLEAHKSRELVEGGAAAAGAGAVLLLDLAPVVAVQPGGASGSVAVRVRW